MPESPAPVLLEGGNKTNTELSPALDKMPASGETALAAELQNDWTGPTPPRAYKIDIDEEHFAGDHRNPSQWVCKEPQAGSEADAHATCSPPLDLRSDTLSQPTVETRKALASAVVGDDIYNEDISITSLERVIEKEANGDADGNGGPWRALFLPTTSQSNLVGCMLWCGRGDELIIGDRGHSFWYENAAPSVLGGIGMIPLPVREVGDVEGGAAGADAVSVSVSPDLDQSLGAALGRRERAGKVLAKKCTTADSAFPHPATMAAADVVAHIRAPNVHYPQTRLVVVENTHHGTCVPPSYFADLRARLNEFVEGKNAGLALAAKAKGADIQKTPATHPSQFFPRVAMHMDGARLVNAMTKLGVGLSEFTLLKSGSSFVFDSVSICFSKGLGAPVGSVLLVRCGDGGDDEHWHRARVLRKSLGGGMRQAGVLARACQHCWFAHFQGSCAPDGTGLADGADKEDPALEALHKLQNQHAENQIARDHAAACSLCTALCEIRRQLKAEKASLPRRPCTLGEIKFDFAFSTNMVFVKIEPVHAHDSAENEELAPWLRRHGIIVGDPYMTGGYLRLVTHLDVSAGAKVAYVKRRLREYFLGSGCA